MTPAGIFVMSVYSKNRVHFCVVHSNPIHVQPVGLWTHKACHTSVRYHQEGKAHGCRPLRFAVHRALCASVYVAPLGWLALMSTPWFAASSRPIIYTSSGMTLRQFPRDWTSDLPICSTAYHYTMMYQSDTTKFYYVFWRFADRASQYIYLTI